MQLDGVNGGDGYYGTQDRVISFTVGRSMVTTADIGAHTLTVRRNGTVVRVLPMSAGGSQHATWEGTMVVMDREDHIEMQSETVGLGHAYDVKDVRYALRLTTSGTFVHAAPWNQSFMGRANRSHGCIGLSLTNAGWFWDNTLPGDVVTVTRSTSDTVAAGNGFGDWNVPWTTWLAGGALKAGSGA
jgi:lipoprotein-anchoring transpeptidase ErfK/SrfK